MTSAADPIVPDTKSWTWVLQRPCPECGLDTRKVAPTQVAGLLRGLVGSWHAVLTGDGALTTRPTPGTWSPLEYGCHVRDVFHRFDGRLLLMLSEVDPLFPDWDQDRTALEDGYAEQDPVTVAQELSEAGTTLADRFGAVSGAQWDRTGGRDDGSRFTIATFSRYLVHDPIHHLYDVTGVTTVHS
jgi:hypothetical protein